MGVMGTWKKYKYIILRAIELFRFWDAKVFLDSQDDINLSTQEHEVDTLKNLIDDYNVKTVFELGTFRGLTTEKLAKHLKGKKGIIYTLDIEDYCNSKKFDDNVIRLFGDSKRFNFSPYHDKIDMFFIDGHHDMCTLGITPSWRQN